MTLQKLKMSFNPFKHISGCMPLYYSLKVKKRYHAFEEFPSEPSYGVHRIDLCRDKIGHEQTMWS